MCHHIQHRGITSYHVILYDTVFTCGGWVGVGIARTNVCMVCSVCVHALRTEIADKVGIMCTILGPKPRIPMHRMYQNSSQIDENAIHVHAISLSA